MKAFLKYLLVLFVATFSFQQGQATHIMGFDMTYECINPCLYKINQIIYFDCCGALTQPSLPITWPPVPNPNPARHPRFGTFSFSGSPIGCSPAPTQVSGWTITLINDVTPVCNSAVSTCRANPSIPTICGVMQVTREGEFNMCGSGTIPCTSFRLSYSDGGRNNVITSGAASTGLFTNSTVIDLSVTPCNNSPTFVEPPISFICLAAGTPQVYNQGAVDPDGDSLVYRLTPCQSGNGTNVNYNAGFSFLQPLGADWNVTMDPATGDITFDPQPGSIQIAVICFEVIEFRNGIQIGSVKRDMQVQVLNLNCGQAPQLTAQNYTLGGVPIDALTTSVVSTCMGAELCFDIPVLNPQAFDYEISWNPRGGLPGATFVDASTGAAAPFVSNGAAGTPTGRFCWTPTSPGIYFFTVRVRDDQCPLNGVQDQTYTIRVSEPLNQTTAIATPGSNCNEVQLCALPNSSIRSPYKDIYTYSWSGNGNFDASNPFIAGQLNDSCLSHIYPAPGNYFYDLVVTDTFGCTFDYRGFLNVVGQVSADAGPDLTICSGFQYSIGTPALPNQNYSWSPATNLSNPNVAQPIFQRPASNLPDTFDYQVTVTDANDPRCLTRDFVRVVVNANLSVSVSPINPQICRGQSVTLTATGGTTYQWSNQPAPGGNTITFTPRSSTVISVAAFERGCTSPPTFITVTVDPGPQGFITGDNRICDGETTLLVASGGTSYRWSDPAAVGNLLALSNVTSPTTVWMIPIDNGCEGDTVWTQVEPYALPAADFSFDRVCEGLPTMFQDASVLSEGVIVSWEWDFGDPSSGTANTSSQENPDHTFSAPGTYTVTLEVVTNNGCRDLITQQITVDAIPSADFNFQNVCEGLSHTFNNSSTISVGTVSQYTWRFGDGNTDPNNNPTHQFSTPGVYNVTLVAETPNGCIDSITKAAFYHPNPNADFSVLNACQDSVVLAFNGSSVGGGLDIVNQWSWDFGDPSSPNNTSSLENPTHVYAQAGPASIRLIVTTGNGCTNDTTGEVVVHESPVSDFNVEGTCENAPVRFIQAGSANPATPLIRWNWDFGNGQGADTRSATTSYADVGQGIYTVSLQVITTENCRNTISKEVVINPAPEVRFFWENVCAGEEMSFRTKTKIDSSAALPGALARWDWDFGGAGQGFGSGPEVAYTYDAPGAYTVLHSVTSDSGCVSNNSRTVEVYELPAIPDLTEEDACFGESARLLAAAPQNVTVNWYESPTSPSPFHTGYSYVTPILPFTTTYYVEPVSAEGCVNSRQPITATVYEDAEVLLGASRTVVDLPLGVVEFDAVSSVPLVDWSWDFGDGASSTLPEPVHEYREPGRYEVILIVTDERGCSYTRSVLIEVTKTVGFSFPTAFTPNGDGFNDEFTIGAYNLIDFQISVFNRWGNEVYKSNSPDFRWNGEDQSGKAVPEGVYVYVARFLDTNGKMTEQEGTITVMR